MMSNTASLKKEYAERIAPALKNQFQYTSTMQIPKLKKIVINQGLGMAVADKKIIDVHNFSWRVVVGGRCSKRGAQDQSVVLVYCDTQPRS